MKYTGLTVSENAEELFICSFPGCGKFFKTKFSMCRHSLVHTQEKNFACEFCGKKFALQQYLKEHTNTHTSEKPYVCGVAGCQERFSQTGKLSLHRRTHPEYTLKEYHSNSSYNKNQKANTNALTRDSPQGEHKRAVNRASTQSEARKVPESSKPSKTDNKKVWLRQNSGHTITSTNGNEELVRLPLTLCQSPNDAKLTLTKDVLEEQSPVALPLLPEADPLLRYLNCLTMPFCSALRPVLPLPEKVRSLKIKASFPYTSLDLFELISKSDD